MNAGFFNPVHASAVQVLGDAGAHYLAALKPAQARALPARLRRKGLRVLIACGGAQVGAAWRKAGIEVLESSIPAHEIVYALRRAFAQANTRRITVHGVFVSVHGTGLLIAGPAAVGKSALALELVARGHALVADDAVEIRRPAAGVLTGHCPPLLHGYLETRGLGVLDVKALHGARAIGGQQRLDLIVDLRAGRARAKAAERLGGRRSRRRILGEPVPVLSLSSRLGHNLVTLVEAACLDQKLRQDGADAGARLAQRQARALKLPK